MALSNDQLLADQVKKLYDHAYFGLVATFLNSYILVLVLWGWVEAHKLLMWLTTVLVTSLARLLLTVYYHRAADSRHESKKWRNRFFVSIFLSGLLWGLPAIFFNPSLSFGREVFIAFILGGMVAGAAGSFTAIFSAFYLFSIPALLPLTLRFFLEGSEIHLAMGGMVLIFFLLMSLIAWDSHKDAVHLLILRYEKQHLIEDLQQEIDQRKQAEKELRQQNQRIEKIVATRTAELELAVENLRSEVKAREQISLALKESEEQLMIINNELEQRVRQRTNELHKAYNQFLHAEKLSAVGQLSASIAHEFNNPLQGILSIIKGVRKRAVIDKDDMELIDIAISEGDRIKALIRNLQELNRPTSDKKTLIDLHNCLDSILILQKNNFNSRGITLVRNYAEQLPHIIAVRDQIKQVFLNLLTNAVDACSQPGGIITISTWQDNERVAVAIKDTGIGMHPDDLEKIFQPFYSTKGEVKGTGLGLSVCHGIIQKHQGEIYVESQPGEGATFMVLLPIKGVEENISPEER